MPIEIKEMQRVENAKERLYGVYAQTMGRSELSSTKQTLWQFEQLWNRFLPADRTVPVLDLGCGDGRFLLYLKQMGFDSLHGVDVSSEQVDVAHSLGLTQVVCAQALQYLARYDSYFGIINVQNVLEHLTREELLVWLDAIHKALRPGGEIWIVAPNAFSPLGMSVRYGDLTHELCFTPESMMQALKVCGFGDVRFGEIRPLVHGLKSLVRFILWQGIRSCLYIWRMVEFGEVRPAAVFSHDMQAVAKRMK